MAVRKVTDKERQALLDHPELVMFRGKTDKRDFAGGIAGFAIPALIAVFGPVPMCFTPFAEDHPNLIVVLSLLWVIAVICISVPVIIRYSVWQEKKRNGNYNAKVLRRKMPEELVCNVVTIEYVVPQQSEGAYTEDGIEKTFGYLGYMNYIPLIPGEKVAIVRDDAEFFAFVKREEATESLYHEQ